MEPQKINHKVLAIKEILIAEGYHVRYDSSNLIIAHKKEFSEFDLDLFKKQVLPFIKHPYRRKEAIDLLNGYLVRDCYKNLVNLVSKNPGINNYGITKLVKRTRNQRELSALTDAGFLKRERKKVDESFKYFVTEKGINWIMESD